MATISQNITFKLNYRSLTRLLTVIHLEYYCKFVANEIIACFHYLMINHCRLHFYAKQNEIQIIKFHFALEVSFSTYGSLHLLYIIRTR